MSSMPTEGGKGDTQLNREDLIGVITVVNAQLALMNTHEKTFNGVTQQVTPASFGGYPGAQVVLQAHTNSHAKATTTLENVRAKLENFASALQSALVTMEGVDTMSEAGFQKIAEAGLVATEGTRREYGDSTWGMNEEKTEPKAVPVPVPSEEPADPETCTPEGNA